MTRAPTGQRLPAADDCVDIGRIVLDAFLGSGTTVIAAERTGRRCYGLELEPRYVDTIIRRWQTYAGERAVHRPVAGNSRNRRCAMATDGEDYPVGYGKPPRDSQFKKGCSGN